MNLLNPIWLWGLGALAIPVGIHLLSRKEGKTIRIGSTRFLSETTTSKFSSIRLNEVALLLLRSLLVVLIVLFLADMLIKTSNTASRKWVLIEHTLENDPHIKILLDSFKRNEFEIRRLAKSFPLPDTGSVKSIPDYYQLAEALARENNLEAVVFATNSIAGFKGLRTALPENITWINFPDSARSISAENSTSIPDTLHITLVYDNNFLKDKKIMEAALNVLQNNAPKKVALTAKDIQSFQPIQKEDWIIWLSEQKPGVKSKLLCFKKNAFDRLIVQETKNQWILTQHLTAANAINEHLPVQLMEMFFENTDRTPDNRTVSNALAWDETSKHQSSVTAFSNHSVNKSLFIFILLLFIAERALAFYRKQ